MATRLALSVPAAPRLVDESPDIRVTGCGSGQAVTIAASVDDPQRGRWQSEAEFEADGSGVVDLGVARPRRGGYTRADPLGLFWSLAMDPAAPGAVGFGTPADPVAVDLSVRVNGAVAARARIVRLLMAAGVTRQPVRDDGLVGTFFAPDGQGRHPGVLVVGGSDGGLSEGTAALLASRGFAALALAYFRAEHLPPDLVEIPLEYFETALRWLARQETVAPGGLGVLGRSRGGELALLLASTFRELHGVVGYVPSGLVHAGISGDGGTTAEPRSAWTLDGKSLPFLPLAPPRPDIAHPDPGAALELRPQFLRSLDDRDAAERAAIPVERINGPVMLISGEDDRLWPSTVLAERAIARIAARGSSHPARHLSYADAGHMIGAAGMPATVDTILHPLRGVRLALGGTPAGNAAAAADSWLRVLEFFPAALAAASA